jgi:hypothetical protein
MDAGPGSVNVGYQSEPLTGEPSCALFGCAQAALLFFGSNSRRRPYRLVRMERAANVVGTNCRDHNWRGEAVSLQNDDG